MKVATWVGTVAGVLLLLGMALYADLPLMLHSLASGGWALSWVIPYRAVFFALYALGWWILLASADVNRNASLGYIFWVTSVREAVDRLLPVASVGGSFIGVRLMLWRGLKTTAVSATVIAEIALTLAASYVFAALGLIMLATRGAPQEINHQVLVALLLTLPVPLGMVLLLRYGAVFERLEKIIRALSGLQPSLDGAARLDHEVKLIFSDRTSLLLVGSLELIALVSGCFEVWLTLRLFGHPIGVADAVILESMTVALRHVAFIVPAGLGVQEASLVMFGRVLGIDSDLALAVSVVKRARELIWGIPSLISWQWQEGRRLTHAHPI